MAFQGNIQTFTYHSIDFNIVCIGQHYYGPNLRHKIGAHNKACKKFKGNRR